MNIFKNIWQSIKPAAGRFPAVYVLSLASAVCMTLNMSSWEIVMHGIPVDSATWDIAHEHYETFERITGGWWKASFLALILAFCIGVASDTVKERFQVLKSRISLFTLQGMCLLCTVPLYFLFKRDGSYTNIAYGGIMLALIVLTVFALMYYNGKNVCVPNIIVSGMIAGILSGCVCIGLFIIKWAVSSLLIKIEEPADTILLYIILSFSWIICFVDIFVAYAARPEEEISVPKAFKHIVLYALVPLYITLLTVLYLYLAKSLVTKTLPNGQINWFVSFATAVYFILWFSIRQYKTRFTQLFTNYGSILLFPLIVIQCIAFAIRISAYGYTPTRYASLLYIIFSTIACIVPLVKNGTFIKFVCPLLAAFVVFATLTPFNLIDIPQRNQVARIESIYRKHNLLEKRGREKRLLIENASSVISAEEKATLVSAYDAMQDSKSSIVKPYWWKSSDTDDKVSFKEMFGFRYSQHYADTDGKGHYRFLYEFNNSLNPLSVKDFAELYTFNTNSDNGKAIVSVKDRTLSFDITDEIKSKLIKLSDCEYENRYSYDVKDSQEPIIISQDNGFTIVLTYVSAWLTKDENEKETDWSFNADGYVLR